MEIEESLEDTIQEEEIEESAPAKLIRFMGMQNIADELDSTELADIGRKVIDDYDTDEVSLDDLREQNKKAIALAKQTVVKKTFPWSGAANIKYPLISQAAMNFNARSYPELVQGDKIVKAVVVGNDENQAKQERAERVSTHMSYQLTEEIPNWESDTDKLLMMLPIVGTMFREVAWDEINLRPSINLLLPDELTVSYYAKSLNLSDCRRISKKVTRFKNEILERERAGLWLKIDYTKDADDNDIIEEDQQVFIQQCRYLDLDGDEYEEPYIVLVHEASGKVVRINALYDPTTVRINTEKEEVIKIEPLCLYSDYHFIPAFDGCYYSTGFGSYLFLMNSAIDSLINQLIDSGTLSNMQGGFVGKGIREKMGATPFAPGEWRPIDTRGGDLAANIVPLPSKEPSMVLYQLMVFLIDTGKQMSSITDVMSGVPQGQNTPVGTTLAMIEQGMKVMDAIYKRIYLGFKKEYKMLYKINQQYLDEQRYMTILDNQEAQLGDYSTKNLNIFPVGDTRLSSQMMRTMKTQAARDIAATTPGANIFEATKLLMKAMQIPESEIALIMPETPDVAQLQQMIEFLQGQVQTYQGFIQSGQMQMQMDENQRKNQESLAVVRKDNATALKYLSEAEAKEAGMQLDIYQKQLEIMMSAFNQQKEAADLEKRRLRGMGEQPYNGGNPQQTTGGASGLL